MLVFVFQELLINLLNLLGFFGRNQGFALQLLQIDFSWVWMLSDDVVELRLREFWFVALVVAVLAVAQKIDEDVAVKSLAVFHGNFNGSNYRLDVVTVDMENRTKCCFGNVCTIGRGAPVEVVGGKANLVVDDNMDGSAGSVAV